MGAAGEEFLVALGAELVFAIQIAVFRADREGRRDGDVGQAETRQRRAHQLPAGGRRGDPLAHVEVEYRAAGVACLQLFLAQQRLEGVLGETDRQL